MNLENISIFFLTFFIHPKIKIMIARFPRFVIINSKYNNNYFVQAKLPYGLPTLSVPLHT